MAQNKYAQPCARCGRMAAPGNTLYRIYNDDEDRDVWEVMHSDPRVCEENLAADRAAAERRAKYEQHFWAFRDRFRDAEYPAGWHEVQGRVILDTWNIHGGGEQIVDDGIYVWFIQNNGMDGDDWSRNNVVTGGAGAIGRRLPRTDELVADAELLERERLTAKECAG